MYENLYISTVFLAGLLSFFAPCILPVLPVYVGYFTGQETEIPISGKHLSMKAFGKSIIFVLGLSTSFILLGFGAGALGKILYSDWFLRIAGIFVILLGLHQIGIIKWNFLYRENKLQIQRSKKSDLLGAYLLGFTFSFGWTPCVGPVLAAVLGLSASEGSSLYGGFLMFVYSIGLMIPFLVLAFFSNTLLSKIKVLYKHMNKIKIAGGILIILMGLLLMMDRLTDFTVLIEHILEQIQTLTHDLFG